MEIKCATCRHWLDEEKFSIDTTHVTGRGRNCKICHAKYAREHYLKNREKVIARGKLRYAQDPSVHSEYMKVWRKSSKGRDSRYRELLEQRRKFPEKYQAYLAVQRAVRAKELVKAPCSICGSERNIHAHHDDYTKPLDVIWLCRKHHQERHKSSISTQADTPNQGSTQWDIQEQKAL